MGAALSVELHLISFEIERERVLIEKNRQRAATSDSLTTRLVRRNTSAWK
jgi:hypothetical protein